MMKKTVTANISGIVFHIDEDAYEKLNDYLYKIREHFSGDESNDEILTDIEGRIAEMLQEKINSSKQVINIKDIELVISQLGKPGQMKDEDPSANQTNQKSEPKAEKTSKRLFRDPDNQMLSGVCGGIGTYLNIDPTWVRLAFILLTFLYSSGIIIYIILWIVAPKAKTTAEKLEMQGKKVNLSNIEQSFKEEMDNVKSNFDKYSKETKEKIKKKDVENNLQEIAGVFAKIFMALLKVIGIIIGIALISTGIFFLVSFITTLFAQGFEPPTFVFAFPFWFNDLFGSTWLSLLALSGLILTIGIPVLGLIYLGAKLIFQIDSKSRHLPVILIFLWITGILIFTFSLLKNFFIF